MIDDVAQLLWRETQAVETVEARLRALELLAAAGEDRFVAVALDELDSASERLASLELGRVVALTGAGLGPDVTASELSDLLDDGAEALRPALDALGAAAARMEDARERARAVVGHGVDEITRRLEASGALATA